MTKYVVIATLLLPACSVTRADDYKLYFGLLHSHTSFSDGQGTPEEAYAAARAAGLDFIAITEHNHAGAAGSDGVFLTPELYTQLKNAAASYTQDGKFVAIYGQEVSTISAGNHFNVFNASEICDIQHGDFKNLYETWLPAHPEVPFIQFNHPNYRKDQNPNTTLHKRNNDYGIDDYHGDFAELVSKSRPYVALIEMIVGPAFSTHKNKPHHNGKHEKDYLFYLNKGFRIGVSVGQDNHKDTWGSSTHARLGVWAKELTKDALFEALRSKRCYASEDENIRIMVSVNHHPMGATVHTENEASVNLDISIRDPDEPNAKYTIKLFYDDAVGGEEAQVIEKKKVQGNQQSISFSHTPESGGYYFVKVTQKSNAENSSDDVWTSPIWIDHVESDDAEKEEISWDEADDYIGLEKVVTGTIVRTFNSGRAVFFNFDPDFQNTLSLVLLSKDFDKFGGAEEIQEELMGRTVTVKGVISVYRDRTQILLKDPDQILFAE